MNKILYDVDLKDHILDPDPHPNLKVAATPINKPQIVQPKKDQKDFYGSFKGSPFSPNKKVFDGPHDYTDWEIATDKDFKNIIYSEYKSSNLTELPLPNKLGFGKTYYVRVRYSSDHHLSEWSDPVRFTTIKETILAPDIYTDDSYTPYPTFYLTEFQPIGYSDKWAATHWQISKDINFTQLVLDYTEQDINNYNKLEVTMDVMEPKNTYYVRAKYIGDQGHESGWSRPFEYYSGIYRMSYYLPIQENEQTELVIIAMHDGDKHVDLNKYAVNANVDKGTVRISGDVITWNLPNVDVDTLAHITVYLTRKSDNTVVSDKLTKELTIKAVNLTSDQAINIANFSNYLYNDGWDVNLNS